MSTHRHVRVEVEGTGLNGRREVLATSMIASAEQRLRRAHLIEARFRAHILGLRGPYRIVREIVGMSVAAPSSGERFLRDRFWRRPAPDSAPNRPAEQRHAERASAPVPVAS